MEPDIAMTCPARPFEEADLLSAELTLLPTCCSHRLPRDTKSKGDLQNFIIPQKSKWPVGSMGKFTQKTNMSKMRAVLLNRSIGFTISAPPSMQRSSDSDEHSDGSRDVSAGNPEPTCGAVGVSDERPSPATARGGHHSRKSHLAWAPHHQ